MDEEARKNDPVPAPPYKKNRHRFWTSLLIICIAVAAFVGYGFYLVAKEGTKKPSDQKRFTVGRNGEVVAVVDKTRLVRNTSPSLGSPTARVQIVEFGDFECPFCKESYPIIRSLAAEYGNRIQYVFRHYPVPSLHEHAQAAAEAAVCAHEQGKFWAYHDRLFQNQENLDTVSLRAYALTVGMDITALDACLGAEQTRALVAAEVADAVAVGVRGTPTWFINGVKVEGSRSAQEFRDWIDALLAQTK